MWLAEGVFKSPKGQYVVLNTSYRRLDPHNFVQNGRRRIRDESLVLISKGKEKGCEWSIDVSMTTGNRQPITDFEPRSTAPRGPSRTARRYQRQQRPQQMRRVVPPQFTAFSVDALYFTLNKNIPADHASTNHIPSKIRTPVLTLHSLVR
jgi:hypothetical protein